MKNEQCIEQFLKTVFFPVKLALDFQADFWYTWGNVYRDMTNVR